MKAGDDSVLKKDEHMVVDGLEESHTAVLTKSQ